VSVISVTEGMLESARNCLPVLAGVSDADLAEMYRRMHALAPSVEKMAPVPVGRQYPPQDRVSDDAIARALRALERVDFHVTGYVATHRSNPRKVIIDSGRETQIRWISGEDFARVIAWQEPRDDGSAPAGFLISEEAQDTVQPPLAQPAARAMLTVAVTRAAAETVEASLGTLATELGCCFSDAIAHNSGWFVPGKPIAYASPLDAIYSLVESLKSGGTVYKPAGERPVSQATTRPEKDTAPAAAVAAPAQQGLF
jgi:hypothetical protein